MSGELIVLAFVGGTIGAIMNTTPCFISYGIVGLVSVLLTVCHVQMPFYNDMVNIVFIPGICMSGAVAGVAFAANRRKHKIVGSNCQRSLWFTNDPLVYLIGGLFGVMGYFLITVSNFLHFPIDTGAFALVLLSLLARVVVSRESLLSCRREHVCYLSRYLLKNWRMSQTPWNFKSIEKLRISLDIRLRRFWYGFRRVFQAHERALRATVGSAYSL